MSLVCVRACGKVGESQCGQVGESQCGQVGERVSVGKLERVYWGKLDRESMWGELEIVWGKLVWASWRESVWAS